MLPLRRKIQNRKVEGKKRVCFSKKIFAANKKCKNKIKFYCIYRKKVKAKILAKNLTKLKGEAHDFLKLYLTNH